MIARIWHGRTTTAKADEYLAFLQRRALPDYRAGLPQQGDGFLQFCRPFRALEGGALLHREDQTGAHLPEGRRTDIARAKYYPEDSGFLLEFEPTVQHHELYS